MRLKLLLAAAALIGTIVGARAAVITRTFDVTASGFGLLDGPGSDTPTDPVEINFTLTFDPSVSIEPTTTGLTVNTFNLPDPVSYAYVASDVEPALVLGSKPGISPPSTDCVLGGGVSWCMNMSDPAGVPGAPNVTLFQRGTADGSIWGTNNITINVVVGSAGPEPAAWALLLLGFAAVAASRFLRRGREDHGRRARVDSATFPSR